MVKLTRIYTRGGDKGRTSLGDGSRVAKHDLRVEAYGTVDEANAAVGLARLHAEGEADAMLARIQNDLFRPRRRSLPARESRREKKAGAPPLRVVDAQVLRLEREIDEMNAALQPLESFVLPAGVRHPPISISPAPSRAGPSGHDHARVKSPVNPIAIKYINRLSDHLFVLARYLNDGGKGDILWRPGAHR
jgi:ATP:cob(I)alamin adenosyltransferase